MTTRAGRARRRDQTLARQAPVRVVAKLLLTGLLAGVWWWWPSWIILVLLAIPLFSLVMEIGVWVSARRRLKHPRPEGPARRGARPQPLEERQDPALGRIAWRREEEGWCVDHLLQDEQVVVRLEGPRKEGPTVAASTLWSAIRPVLPEFWAQVVSHVVRWSTRQHAVPLDPAELSVQALHISPGEPLEGGEVVFFFSAATDPDGSYFVPVRQGKPLLVHRES